MTGAVDTNGPLFGGAPTWYMLDLLRARLNGAGILYVSIDLVQDVYPHYRASNHAHTDTARAFVIATREFSNDPRKRRPPSRQMKRHFAAERASRAHGCPWVIDNRERSWPESTASAVARTMTRMVDGATTNAKKTRLWFPDLPAALFACSWPWTKDWGASDLHQALANPDQPIEVTADYLQHIGLVDLGQALMHWEYQERAEAAVAVFKAAEPIRQAARALATQLRVESEQHAKDAWAYQRSVQWPDHYPDRPPHPGPFIESERVQELRRELLAFGAGVPLPRAAAIECCAVDPGT
jgi:hypothetical protein